MVMISESEEEAKRERVPITRDGNSKLARSAATEPRAPRNVADLEERLKQLTKLVGGLALSNASELRANMSL